VRSQGARLRRAFSSTEVIVCTAILALALVPIITMIAGGTRPTAFNEYHLIAQSVATHLADRATEVILSRGFAELESMAAGEKVNLQDTRTYKIPPETSADRLLEGSYFLPPEVHLTNLSEAGATLAALSVVVTWTLPGGTSRHSFRLERLLSRPDASLTSDYLPRQEKARWGP
jgi:hypothetical protein